MAKTIQTIKVNNGVLEYRDDGNWYRNGKRFMPYTLKNYKYYDKKYKGWLKLTPDGRTEAYTPTLDKINKLSNYSTRYTGSQITEAPIKKDTKLVNFRTKGALNLLQVPYQLLDSISKNAGRARVPIKEALGLVAKESTINHFSEPLYRIGFKKIKGVDVEKLIQQTKDDYKFSNYELTNNHAYFNNKYSDYLPALWKKYPIEFGKTGEETIENSIKAEIAREKQAYSDMKYNTIRDTTPRYSNNIMVDAFRRYHLNPKKYNPGQENYVPMVNNLGEEAWNDKSLQEYWSKQGKKYYQQGLDMPESTMSQYKFGGQMKKYNPRHKAFIGAIINAATSVASGVANAVMQHKQQLKQNRQDNYEHGLQTAGVLDQLIANQDIVNQQLRNKVAFKYGGRKKCEMGSLAKGILFSALTGAGGIAGAFADRAVQKHDMNQVQVLGNTGEITTDNTNNPQLDNNGITQQRFGGRTQMFMCGGRTKRNRRK